MYIRPARCTPTDTSQNHCASQNHSVFTAMPQGSSTGQEIIHCAFTNCNRPTQSREDAMWLSIVVSKSHLILPVCNGRELQDRREEQPSSRNKVWMLHLYRFCWFGQHCCCEAPGQQQALGSAHSRPPSKASICQTGKRVWQFCSKQTTLAR